MTKTIEVDTITALDQNLDIEADVILSTLDLGTLSGSGLSSGTESLFQLESMDTFDNDDHEWDNKISTCSNSFIQSSSFLGGPCKTSDTEVSKNFDNLPIHSHIRVKANYHMFDEWNGEYGYMKVNDEMVWTKIAESPKHTEKSVNICGSKASDPAFNMLVDVIVPHHGESVKVSFGSSLKTDSCKASYGVDNVMLFVKDGQN
mmetsp:Transcript_31166/g.28351  ORF Transcript_31166/g.28351 Transcript_31166/m.28351 type:complete len:203 (+) Transcript_31166:244-852(+)